MRLVVGFGRLAVFVTTLLFISSAFPSHASRVKDDASGSAPAAKRELKTGGIRVTPVTPRSFDQELQDTREQILDRVPAERNRSGSLLGWLRDWLSRPTDIVQTSGQDGEDNRDDDDDEDDEEDDSDDEEEHGEHDDDDDDEGEEHEDHESPSLLP